MTLPFIVLLFVSLASTTTASSLDEICQKVDFPALCVSSIQFIAPGLASLDERTALKHSITVLHQNIQAAILKAATLPQTQLQECSAGLNDASDSTQTALEDLERNDNGALKANLDANASYFDSCLNEAPGMKDDAERLIQLLKNCWAVGAV